MKNKKVVVTGGAGFIGSNLARELSKNNEIVVIDDLSTGYMSNIQVLKDDKKIKTPLFAILLVVLCTIFTSTGQYFIKLGTADLSSDFLSIILNFPLMGGLVLYGLGAIVLVIALKHGELSVLCPVIALGFVWVFLYSILLLKESILFTNWIGLIVIVLGVSLIGKGANHE